MVDLPRSPVDPRRILERARRDRAGAADELAKLDLDAQVATVCAAPVGGRAALIELAPEPEALIPRLPEAELCFTVKAVGLESATWLIEQASPAQITAAIDLDAWGAHAPEPARLDAWLDALAETGDEPLLRDLRALDPELLVAWLRRRISVTQQPTDDEGWQPPVGSQTLEGQFHFVAHGDKDDVAAILRVLHLLFQRDYWTYFRLMQGVIHELPTENEEWARRWRTARLQDLGFPPWEEAMGLYVYLEPEQRGKLPADERPLDVAPWRLPVWVPGLPEGRDAPLLFRAMAGLGEEERRSAFYAFVAVANMVAVADQMDLADAETTPRAIEKAAHWIGRGLEYLAAENGIGPVEGLRRASLQHLFRVGANLDPEASRPRIDDEQPADVPT